eukprot:scaffold98044_cov72-Phaeocystis_antarctica.AAC.1
MIVPGRRGGTDAPRPNAAAPKSSWWFGTSKAQAELRARGTRPGSEGLQPRALQWYHLGAGWPLFHSRGPQASHLAALPHRGFTRPPTHRAAGAPGDAPCRRGKKHTGVHLWTHWGGPIPALHSRGHCDGSGALGRARTLPA